MFQSLDVWTRRLSELYWILVLVQACVILQQIDMELKMAKLDKFPNMIFLLHFKQTGRVSLQIQIPALKYIVAKWCRYELWAKHKKAFIKEQCFKRKEGYINPSKRECGTWRMQPKGSKAWSTSIPGKGNIIWALLAEEKWTEMRKLDEDL